MNKIITIVILCFCLFSISSCQTKKNEYRTDLEPIINRFSVFTDIQKSYWKTSVDKEDNRLIPTSDYWMAGFFAFNSEQFESFKAEYEWEFPQMDFGGFGESVDPSVIDSASEKKWGYNQEFNDLVMPKKFSGSIFLDINNGIIFFKINTQ